MASDKGRYYPVCSRQHKGEDGAGQTLRSAFRSRDARWCEEPIRLVPTRLVARSPVRRGSEKGFATERGLGRRGEDKC
jgi:hypothetical protein